MSPPEFQSQLCCHQGTQDTGSGCWSPSSHAQKGAFVRAHWRTCAAAALRAAVGAAGRARGEVTVVTSLSVSLQRDS